MDLTFWEFAGIFIAGLFKEIYIIFPIAIIVTVIVFYFLKKRGIWPSEEEQHSALKDRIMGPLLVIIFAALVISIIVLAIHK